jgi:hypothetical protein
MRGGCEEAAKRGESEDLRELQSIGTFCLQTNARSATQKERTSEKKVT